MKKILIIALLLVLSVTLKTNAQTNLGVDKNTLIASLSEDKSKEFVNVGKSSDGLSYTLYRDAVKV